MASQTPATVLSQKTGSGSQTKTKTNARRTRGEGLDLRERQRRMAREQNDRRESEEARKRNEELLGRRLEALSKKYKQRDDDQQEGGKGRRKGGRGVAVPLFGGGGGVKVDTEGVQFRSNAEALPQRRYPKAPRKQQTHRRRPAGAEFDATAAAFGPALCGLGPPRAPKLPVIWGPGMNPPPPTKIENPEPKMAPQRTENAVETAASPAKKSSPINYASMAAKPPTPPRPQTPPSTTPLADPAPTNDVWGAETDEDDDDEDFGASLEPGQAWGSV